MTQVYSHERLALTASTLVNGAACPHCFPSVDNYHGWDGDWYLLFSPEGVELCVPFTCSNGHSAQARKKISPRERKTWKKKTAQ